MFFKTHQEWLIRIHWIGDKGEKCWGPYLFISLRLRHNINIKFRFFYLQLLSILSFFYVYQFMCMKIMFYSHVNFKLL